MYKWRRRGEALFFILPILIPLIVFWIYPIIRSGWISFTNWDYMTPEYDFVGLKNYKDLLSTGGFFPALKNTLVFGTGDSDTGDCRGIFACRSGEKSEEREQSLPVYLIFTLDYPYGGYLYRLDLDLRTGYRDCQSRASFFTYAGSAVAAQFSNGNAFRDSGYPLEDLGVCHDILSDGIGKGSGRAVRCGQGRRGIQTGTHETYNYTYGFPHHLVSGCSEYSQCPPGLRPDSGSDPGRPLWKYPNTAVSLLPAGF